MSFSIRKLTDPTKDELDQIVKVFNLAFSSEGAFRAVVGPENIDRLLPALNTAQAVAGSLAGEIYVAEDESNKKIIGAIIWFGPGREMYDSDDQRQLALGPLMAQFPDDVKAWYVQIMPTMDEFKKRALGDSARTQWYLQRVGVLPDQQGRGVGTALIEEGRRQTNGLGIALEAVELANVSYYEHLGFRNKGHVDIKALHGNFTVTAMIWHP